MIVFDLQCSQAHVFEAWFGSSADHEHQAAAGMIACPFCGDTQTAKAVMAPAVPAKGNRSDGAAALLAAQRRIEAESDYVGDNFATEARARHKQAAPGRPIYGEATVADAQALVEEGIGVLPLPFKPLVRSDA
jgi:hypothetical protein